MSGLEAIKHLKEALEIGVQYQIIFTDFNMPQMNGIQASKKMREILHQKGYSRV